MKPIFLLLETRWAQHSTQGERRMCLASGKSKELKNVGMTLNVSVMRGIKEGDSRHSGLLRHLCANYEKHSVAMAKLPSKYRQSWDGRKLSRRFRHLPWNKPLLCSFFFVLLYNICTHCFKMWNLIKFCKNTVDKGHQISALVQGYSVARILTRIITPAGRWLWAHFLMWHSSRHLKGATCSRAEPPLRWLTGVVILPSSRRWGDGESGLRECWLAAHAEPPSVIRWHGRRRDSEVKQRLICPLKLTSGTFNEFLWGPVWVSCCRSFSAQRVIDKF